MKKQFLILAAILKTSPLLMAMNSPEIIDTDQASSSPTKYLANVVIVEENSKITQETSLHDSEYILEKEKYINDIEKLKNKKIEEFNRAIEELNRAHDSLVGKLDHFHNNIMKDIQEKCPGYKLRPDDIRSICDLFKRKGIQEDLSYELNIGEESNKIEFYFDVECCGKNLPLELIKKSDMENTEKPFISKESLINQSSNPESLKINIILNNFIEERYKGFTVSSKSHPYFVEQINAAFSIGRPMTLKDRSWKRNILTFKLRDEKQLSIVLASINADVNEISTIDPSGFKRKDFSFKKK